MKLPHSSSCASASAWNRSARIVSVSDSANEANVWAGGDEATDFLGLNAEVDETPEATVDAADLPDTRSWLLEHVGPSAPYAVGGIGALALGLLLPVLLPAPRRPPETDEELRSR